MVKELLCCLAIPKGHEIDEQFTDRRAESRDNSHVSMPLEPESRQVGF